jgi:hypothetical protein
MDTFLVDISSTLRVRADTFNDILNANSNRDAERVNLNIKLTLTFDTTNPLPQGSEIKVFIPTDQAVLSGAALAINA